LFLRPIFHQGELVWPKAATAASRDAQRYARKGRANRRSPAIRGSSHALIQLTRRADLVRPKPATAKATTLMPKVEKELHKAGDFLVDYEEKVFPDVKADPGEKALVTFHTVAFEGSIGIVNTLVATRLLRKGYETTILLYGPGVTLGFQRGFPTLGDEAFPGHLFVNQRLAKFMEEGGKIYSCRFSTQALYGQTEKAFIPGIVPINPLDVLDCILLHKKAGATIIDTWTV
jgi:uncharacterized repeat protein (TIGR04044 family)